MSETFSDNPAQGRYELIVDGKLAKAEYERHGSTVTLTHVVAEESLRGTGAAGRLMQHIADTVRAEGGKIVAQCPYAASWMERHPDQKDLLV